MGLEGRLAGEGCVTDGAVDGKVSRRAVMQPHVNRQSGLDGERLLTHLALVRFFAGVYSRVPLQVAGLLEPLLTKGALVGEVRGLLDGLLVSLHDRLILFLGDGFDQDLLGERGLGVQRLLARQANGPSLPHHLLLLCRGQPHS